MSGIPPPEMLPGHVVIFGPGGNCTLDLCPIEWSVYQYRPSLPANVTFLAIFALAMGVHIYLGIRWRSWAFMTCMILGCLSEIIGYIGRIILYQNPFSFGGFMLQIVFVTSSPVYYTAAIYVTLSKIVNHLGPELARVKPKLFYWVFIPTDLVCLVLQAAGGALSTVSQGVSQTGVDIALAGLGMQVGFLFIFWLLFADFLFRYYRSESVEPLNRRTKLFFGFMSLSTALILGRCAYRCYELSKGYRNSDLITDEGLFIGLEGVLIAAAVFSLCIGHPGFVYGKSKMLRLSPAAIGGQAAEKQ